jgi:hypothetical protein
MSQTTQTPLYDAMLASIEAMKDVDVTAGIEDPAQALAVAHRLATNLEPERQAAAVRLRAERGINVLSREAAGLPPKYSRRRK